MGLSDVGGKELKDGWLMPVERVLNQVCLRFYHYIC